MTDANSETMKQLYKLRSGIRKLYNSSDTSRLKDSIYKSLTRSYSSNIDSCIISLDNYSITITCKPLTSVNTKKDIINTVVKKLKNFIVDHSEISSILEEDTKQIKSTLELSDSFVCDTYIMGDTISFLL